ncbi:MAG: outer membrane protein assembly factor BamA [Alphaproteobacteria bacterium]|nr:outer membrane protein assembly factor BamA [Alphaproteobacteria bacterium]
MKFKLAGISLLALAVCTQAMAQENINSIKINGLQRVERETALSYAGINTSKPVSTSELNLALKRLYDTGLFSDISFDTKGNTLIINVTENPVIGVMAFDGNDKIDDKILESEVQSAPRSVFSKSKVQQDVQRILDVYKRAGRYGVSVEPKIIKKSENRVDLIFEIEEGPEAKIDTINFIGNKHYTGKDLQGEIMSKESRWYRLFSSAENFDREKMNYDQELLRRFYNRHGYADFAVVSAIAELSRDKTSFVLTFTIDEGTRYKINDIQIKSMVPDVDANLWYKDVTFKVGDWYNSDEIEKTVNALTEDLAKKGFVFVEVVPNIHKDRQSGKLSVVFDIKENAKVFVNRINITGNTRTLDEVIRREFRIAEGNVFNVAKIKESRRNVERLNFFSKVDIDSERVDYDKADINVNVEEKSTGYFNVGVGYSTVNGALVRAGITENNFLGKGQEVSLNAGVSQRTTDYSFSFTEPYFMNRRLSAGTDLFYQTEDYQDESNYDMDTVGGRVRFGWNYTDDLSQYVRYTLKQDKIKNVSSASKYIQSEQGDAIDSVIGQTLVYDKRDSVMKPREGYYLSFGNDVSGLGGDDKYLKFDAKAYKFYTLSDYYTFKFFINGGYVTGYGDEDVRLAQRYFLGGNTMRGFETGGISARDKVTKDALGGNWMVWGGAELAFPMGLDELGIRGRTFVDVGTTGKPDNINSSDVDYSSSPRVAVGFGFEWTSPMGKIDIDFGFPIVKQKYDETEVFRLNFGTSL